ncbi:MAG: hypothetical protein BWY76_01345 [bacterium ADurb.Bin429]|nr:MAG: hypothetical protein BWY76_01345 [bacterium ADurb.Bin429]
MLDNAGLSSAFVAYGKADPQGAAFVAPADTNGLRFDGTPVVLSGASATSEVVFSENTHDGKKLLAVSPTAVMLGDGVALRGNALIRGRETFSCDGKAAVFTVRFPRPYPDAPYVVASSNLPIGMGVTGVTVNNFTVTFATPPPAGEKNLTITWIVTQ